MSQTIDQQLYNAVADGDVVAARQLLADHPEKLRESCINNTWLHEAASYGHLEIVKLLLGMGLDINAPEATRPDGPLSSAVGRGHVEVVRYLLEHGANPNAGRLLIGAINCDKDAFEIVKLLVDHGADVNRTFPFGDDDGPIFNALSWAIDSEKQEIVDYLRAHGAEMPPSKQPKKPTHSRDEVVDHFRTHFGPVQETALGEIVPSDPPVLIRVVPGTKDRKQLTLFTVGMSEKPMDVPPGGEAYQFAELAVHLPADWPLTKKSLQDPNHSWPIDWLRRIARYPFDNDTWLGGPVTIISNDDPPRRFSPNNKFTAMLLVANLDQLGEIHRADGRVIKVYTLLPLYPGEQELEMSEGVEKLFALFDQFKISNVVDIKRRNVAVTG